MYGSILIVARCLIAQAGFLIMGEGAFYTKCSTTVPGFLIFL